MKYKVTLKDGIELLITADKEVDAVRQAKDIKDSLSAVTKMAEEKEVSDANNAATFMWVRDVLSSMASDAASVMATLQLEKNPDAQTLRWVEDKRVRIKSKLQEVLRSL